MHPLQVCDPGGSQWCIDLSSDALIEIDHVTFGYDASRTILNDVSLRNLIPGELAKGFGFFQSKPSSAFSPVAVTPDELGDAWDGGKVKLPRVKKPAKVRFKLPHMPIRRKRKAAANVAV